MHCDMKDHLARAESIGKYISVLHRYSMMEIGKELEPLGIGVGQFHFLMCLSHHDGVSQESISSHLRYDKATVTRGIKKLEENGYVRREKDEEDGRVQRVYMTDEGREIVGEVKKALTKNSDILLEGFSPEERKTLFELMAKMFDNAVKHHEGCE